MPIGPDFHDPPPATPIPELPPSFGVTKPPLETVVDLNASGSGSFDVAISDPNVRDTIRVRWIANYPPFASESTRLVGEDSMFNGTGQFHFLKNVVCADLRKAADRTLSIVVADNNFLQPEAVTDTVNQFSYYQDDTGAVKQSFVIGSWRITGCLQ